MKTLISEQLWQHLKPPDGQEKMTTSTSSSVLHLDVTKCKVTVLAKQSSEVRITQD